MVRFIDQKQSDIMPIPSSTSRNLIKNRHLTRVFLRKKISPDNISWSEKTKASKVFFWFEVSAVSFGIMGFCLALYGTFITLEEIKFSRKEAADSRAFRENTELPLAKKTLEEIEAAGSEREADRKEREAASLERIVQLYNTAINPRTAPAARKKTIEFLLKQKQDLSGLNLSCMINNTNRTTPLNDNFKCPKKTFLDHLDISRKKIGYSARLRKVNLSYSSLVGARLNGHNLSEAKFIDTNLLAADLSSTVLYGADFTKAKLFKTKFIGANLTSTDFTSAINIDKADFTSAWAIIDQRYISLAKPKGLPQNIGIVFCRVPNPFRWTETAEKPDNCRPE